MFRYWGIARWAGSYTAYKNRRSLPSGRLRAIQTNITLHPGTALEFMGQH